MSPPPVDHFVPTKTDLETLERMSACDLHALAAKTAMVAGAYRALALAERFGTAWLRVHLEQSVALAASALADIFDEENS